MTALAFTDSRLSLLDLLATCSEELLRLRPFESNNERTVHLVGKLFLAVSDAQSMTAPAERMAMFRALPSTAASGAACPSASATGTPSAPA